jgi:hypothetical protein
MRIRMAADEWAYADNESAWGDMGIMGDAAPAIADAIAAACGDDAIRDAIADGTDMPIIIAMPDAAGAAIMAWAAYTGMGAMAIS